VERYLVVVPTQPAHHSDPAVITMCFLPPNLAKDVRSTGIVTLYTKFIRACEIISGIFLPYNGDRSLQELFSLKKN